MTVTQILVGQEPDQGNPDAVAQVSDRHRDRQKNEPPPAAFKKQIGGRKGHRRDGDELIDAAALAQNLQREMRQDDRRPLLERRDVGQPQQDHRDRAREHTARTLKLIDWVVPDRQHQRQVRDWEPQYLEHRAAADQQDETGQRHDQSLAGES